MASTWTCQARLPGLDANTPLTLKDGMLLRRLGYRFVVRYVKRDKARANDLTAKEIKLIHQAGLGLMAVQHVESESSWEPTQQKGALYANNAVAHCLEVGLAKGTTVWLDLEGVQLGIPANVIVQYCNTWHQIVQAAGFQPGIYVGWHAGLSPSELYRRLKFDRYWAAYNLNKDQYPETRGICMRQTVMNSPAGIGFPVDGDVIAPDNLGGLPTLFVPDEWDPK